MIYAHSHNVFSTTGRVYAFSKSLPHQTVQEKCYLCDVMHHNNMVISGHVFFNDMAASAYLYRIFHYNFNGARTAHSSSRAPPVLNS
jgi:hypothetical protein